MSQPNLNLSNKSDGPVECLGESFPNDQARREHYLKLLEQKLKDPEFRKIEGFPIGKDEDILALSDPPYFTACPNPWLGEFVKCYGTTYDPKQPYHREPFAADVSEGKTHSIYTAHAYHTKVPHRAIMRYILHYTQPGDVVFDGFAGTGMTGVAAQFCGDRSEVQELGYRVQNDDAIVNEDGKVCSRLGSRRAVLDDLAPVASFIAANYNTPINAAEFEREAGEVLNKVQEECGWMFQTKHKDGKTGRINFTVWSEVFSCPECTGEIVFVKEAFDREAREVLEEFDCPKCKASLSKDRLQLLYETRHDSLIGTTLKVPKRVPVIINYTVGSHKFEKEPDSNDLAILDKIEKLPLPTDIPKLELPDMQMARVGRMQPAAIKFIHQFFLPRAAQGLACLWKNAKSSKNQQLRHALQFFVETAIWTNSVLNRYRPSGFSQVNQFLSGVFYVPSQHSEPSPWYVLEGKLDRLVKTFALLKPQLGRSIISTQDCSSIAVPDESVDYIFTDPPFGENIYYSDLNILIESWHGVRTNPGKEAIVDKVKGKKLKDYQQLMQKCFEEFFRILKPGRWITVEFSNSQAAVWNSIQTTLQEAGFVVANVAALDKQQRSFQSVTSPTAVKQDLVISAYKPNGGLEDRFAKRGETEEGVWDFIRTHLRNLPVVKARGGQLEFVTERDPRILYDRMVAFYVGHSTLVPLSSAEFQAVLAEKFPERDGMFFLPEQVNEYDKKRAQMENIGQLTIFVEDERSASNWLRNFLKDRPSTYQDIQPEFMQQLGAGWKKWEARPELNALLNAYFLCYDGTSEVPSQIHSYLSTQFKELRNLPKDHAQLKAKAKNRWFVPDPKNLIQVEQQRNKKLLEEFWSYLPDGYTPPSLAANKGQTLPGLTVPRPKIPKGKKLKELRTEAVRVGFKHCYQNKDYTTILVVADMIPESVLNEDEQLQMIYDTAVTRTGNES